MRRRILTMVGAVLLASALTASAYMPTGWTWFSWPYAYDHSYATSWYYLYQPSNQWCYRLSTQTWSLLGQSALSSGWTYFEWPYAYSHQTGGWFYLDESYGQWCLRMDSGIWSRYGRSTCETYNNQVADFKAKYGKSNEWESWMIVNKTRYLAAFNAAKYRPGVLPVSFRYETTPIIYNPAWTGEAQHMAAFTTMARGAYPNYIFRLLFNGDTVSSYANVIAGIAVNNSHAIGKNVYLYYETIFEHEFAHVMNIPHHYDTPDQTGDGMHMPPGETQCLMDRNSSVFCTACRTALGIPLGIPQSVASAQAMSDIISRYP